MIQIRRKLTADEFLAVAERFGRSELIRGEVQMMTPAGGRHGSVAANLLVALGQHVREHGLGKVYAAETGFLLERNPDTVRAPDLAFIRSDRLEEAETERFISISPDLVAEVLSPGERSGESAEKVQWWLDHGVKVVWVVEPQNRQITVHRPGVGPQSLSEDDILEEPELLGAFRLPVSEIFV